MALYRAGSFSYYAGTFAAEGVGQFMPLPRLPQSADPTCARSVMESGVAALENMLLTHFRKLGPVAHTGGQIRVIYKDADLRLCKIETYRAGEQSPIETQYWLDGSQERHVLRLGMSASERKAVMTALLAEVESLPTLRDVLQRRSNTPREKGDGIDATL